ncbi:MAG: sulfurtransferase [Sinobacteraceae bacterium]|nr:sulfurtransferase [Nevskiaceae bacterium]
MTFTNPQYLVETAWLEAHLNDPALRILDCTVLFATDADGVRAASGRDAWAEGHIPGSGFADLMQDLSDRNSSVPFMMPPAAQFAEAMSRYGIGEDTHVVLYDACSDLWAHMWAARIWWMLRVCGFEQAAVLNGGWHKWTMEGRPVSTDPSTYPPAHFVARPRPELMADKREVLATIGDNHTCLLNALTVEDHTGTAVRYGRAGHIPSSVNVPTAALIDPVTHAYLPAAQLHAQFEVAGTLNRERVITYCGGGIAASSDAFVLTLLGAPNVAVYDGSLLEWAADPALPMETA